jgi:hypothetical protein
MTQPLNKRWHSCFEYEVPYWAYLNKRGEESALFSTSLYFSSLTMNIRQLSSSTEAEVDIILPGVENDLTSLLIREGTFPIYLNAPLFSPFSLESFLKTLFIVSKVSVIGEGPQGTSSLPWFYEDSVQLPGETAILSSIT